ncbi:hypothetical protein GGTG_04145 [Gaeumannomyces tritici R3-111a-1]|uniref:Uncharacterized protein n=1 Tax=Gaeumannomyces tritici (strain R3-111a-1) TaxID=644352 RepID=J3NSA0_GAET3|nr:hypothetical protein GGTG_04145 [Gaeumannomyces tritici R3-111a-1]EJT79056.1 hypothetical protein GGTG_04145 [Gaeumannomyces tritici R3-111a-1]
MGVGGGDGLTGFANRVFGGEVGGDHQYEGRGQTEQISFPEYIPQWVIFGVGFLGSGKDHALSALEWNPVATRDVFWLAEEAQSLKEDGPFPRE